MNVDGWSVGLANEFLGFLVKRRMYLTNLVKWTGSDAALPDSKKVKLFLPVLEREIEIVKPRRIVTFGLMPFESLTGIKIRLSDYFKKAIKTGRLKTYDININGFKARIIPSYFPVGRGNPRRAVELLKLAGRL
jgi:uracil-DNA glycosylase family 4